MKKIEGVLEGVKKELERKGEVKEYTRIEEDGSKTGVVELDLGDTVLCDICNRDWSKSKFSAGFVLGATAVCPVCQLKMQLRGDIAYMKEAVFCPKDISFPDWIRRDYRNADRTIEDLQDIIGIIK